MPKWLGTLELLQKIKFEQIKIVKSLHLSPLLLTGKVMGPRAESLKLTARLTILIPQSLSLIHI